jgi:hypothetical protein
MVVHIVFFKFKEQDKDDNIQKAETMLKALEGRVPSLRSIEVGVNFSREERAMDMSIVTTFDDKEGLQAYAVDPYHKEVIAFIKEVCEYTKVVDYEK